jgi:thiol-disulfide isomerase/thioredoxin
MFKMWKVKGKDMFKYIIVITIIFIFAVLISNKQTIEGFFNSDNKKYSVEYFYMEGCGHCIEFNDSGIWEQLNNSAWANVSLKKYNRSENLERVNELNISSFPTIIIVDNSNKTPHIIASFEEERTYDKLFNFIKKYE